MQRLVVISGPANSGKMPLARKLLVEDPDLILVHRDHLRASFEINQPTEGQITFLMGEFVRGILQLQRSTIVVAWNLERSDRELWWSISENHGVPLQWLDVREPQVAAMIPPLKEKGK